MNYPKNIKVGDFVVIMKDGAGSTCGLPLKKGDISEVLFIGDTGIRVKDLWYLPMAGRGIGWEVFERGPATVPIVPTSERYSDEKPKHVPIVSEFKGSMNLPYDPDIDDIEDYKWR